ncbi:MAG: VOC family protein [Thermoleophilia bacterium]|nr:VOC family protein [Thermoleophilia bacterium]
MPDSVVHFDILGPDGPALQAFYAELFGWTYTGFDGSDEGMADYALTTAGEGTGIGGGVGASTDGRPSVTVYAGVADAQEALDRAVALGATVVQEVTRIPGVVTFARFRDPQGNVMGVASGPPPAEG